MKKEWCGGGEGGDREQRMRETHTHRGGDEEGDFVGEVEKGPLSIYSDALFFSVIM